LSTACKSTEFACGASLPFTNLLKGLRQLVVLLQKVIGYPFEPFACGIRELHATPSMSAIYRWENFISNKQKNGQIKKSFNHPRSIYISSPIQSDYFQVDLIWCDGTFNK
jgi:hypothetical protein